MYYGSSVAFNVKHFLLLFSLLMVLVLSPTTTFAASVVRSLPGYPGDLPFHLETGYIGVGEEVQIQLFYYYIESDRDPKKDPLMFYLTGGPGTSGLSSLLLENGPLKFASQQSGEVKLLLNPYSWTKVASIIYIDSPVGTGFSYATTSAGYYTDDITTSRHLVEFLKKWLLEEHEELQENPLYVSGESYAGITVPIVVQEILNGNKAGIRPFLNLKGYTLGNPLTEELLNPRYKFAHRVSLLSDELYEVAQDDCHDDFENVDARNTRCLNDIEAISQDLDPLYIYHMLEPSCDVPIPPTWCQNAHYFESLSIWANNIKVREALHIREGTKSQWIRMNYTIRNTTCKQTVESSFGYHQNLTKELFHTLIYSGDQDLAMPYLGTVSWITRLNLPIIYSWKPWFTKGQVSGYSTKYSNGHYHLTFATVKGAGHTSPEYKPEECFNLFKKWLGMQSP